MSQISVDQIVDVNGGNTARINGMTPTAESVQGFRNRLINGNFSIWQRATSFTATATPSYTADRWQVAASGANLTVTRDGTYPRYELVLVANPSNTYAYVSQKIEAANSYDLVSKRVTVSGRLYTTGTGKPMLVRLYYPSAADNFTTVTEFEQFSLTTTADGYTNFSFTSFLELPPEVANGIQVRLDFTSGITAGNIALISCQLEAGSVATPIERRAHGVEKALCDWYYREIRLSGMRMIGAAGGGGWHQSWVFTLPGSMRTTPTWTSNLTTSSTANLSTGPTLLSTSLDAVVIYVISSTSTGLTDFTFSTAAKFTASCEL